MQPTQTQTRGYFGIGVEGLSKAVNAGNLFRCAQGFGASFLFTIGAAYERRDAPTDTSNAAAQLPLYEFASSEEMRLPEGCQLVGLELLDDAIELPTFCHPRRAAYVLGPERGSLSPALVARCDFVVKIPTSFAINVAVAGAIAMYDRMASLRRFAERPLFPGGPPAPLPEHVFGRPIRRRPKTQTHE